MSDSSSASNLSALSDSVRIERFEDSTAIRTATDAMSKPAVAIIICNSVIVDSLIDD